MSDDLRRRARDLRLAGLSRRQIRAALGVGDTRLGEWLRDTRPLDTTRRHRAKDGLRDKARQLRREGKVYREIAAELGVSISSVSLWARDLPAPPLDHGGRRKNAARQRWDRESRRRQISRVDTQLAAAREVGNLTDRELLLVGAVAYWCEGSKSKPWDRREQVVFINSDPALIRLFLRWLDLVRVPESDRRYRVQIHESADAKRAERYWADVVGIDSRLLMRTTLKRHNPVTVRRNVEDDYHGCLVVRVRDSARLYQRVEGWLGGIDFALVQARPAVTALPWSARSAVV